MMNFGQDARERVMQGVGHLHNPEGLDTVSADHFIRAFNWQTSEALVLDSFDTPEFQKTFPSHAFGNEMLGGFADAESGLIVINRKYGSDEGRMHTYVHESTHNRCGEVSDELSKLRWVVSLWPRKIPQTTKGFLSGVHGRFTEEGFADLVGWQQQEVTSPERLAGAPLAWIEDEGKLLPNSFGFYDAAGYSAGTLALTTLCNYRPELIDGLFRAHESRERFADVVGQFNAIDPGLYNCFHKAGGVGLSAKRQGEDGMKVLEHVLDIGGHKIDGDTREPFDDAHLRKYVLGKLANYQTLDGFVFTARNGQSLFPAEK